MKAKIIARWWNDDLVKMFGVEGSEFNLPDNSNQLLSLLSDFGRFEATPPNTKVENNKLVDCWIIEFQNDYD